MIVLIDTANYKHFVVVRRVDDRYVYIADPSWGNRKILIDDFAKIWNQNIIFVVQGPKVGTPEGLFKDKPELAAGGQNLADPGTVYAFPLCSRPGRCYTEGDQYTPFRDTFYSRAVTRAKEELMRPSTRPTSSNSAPGRLGLLVLSALLPLLLVACTSTNQLAQSLRETEGTFLTPLPAKHASKPAKKAEPLKLAAAVPEDNLQDMRGCLGTYFFNYDFDINLTAVPQVKVATSFQAVLPDGSHCPHHQRQPGVL